MNTPHIGKKIKELAQKKGYNSARKLALFMNVTPQKVARDYKMEVLGQDVVTEYCEALKISIEDFNIFEIETQIQTTSIELLKAQAELLELKLAAAERENALLREKIELQAEIFALKNRLSEAAEPAKAMVEQE